MTLRGVERKSAQNTIRCIVSRRNLSKISGKRWCNERRENCLSIRPSCAIKELRNEQNFICDEDKTVVVYAGAVAVSPSAYHIRNLSNSTLDNTAILLLIKCLGAVYMDSGNRVTLSLALPWPRYKHDNIIWVYSSASVYMQRSSLASVSRITLVVGSPALRDSVTLEVETSFNHVNDLTRPPELCMKSSIRNYFSVTNGFCFMAACPARTSCWVCLCVVLTAIILVVVEITTLTFEKVDNIVTNLSMWFTIFAL